MSKADQLYEDTKDLQITYKEALSENNLKRADSRAKLLLEQAGKTADEKSESYKLLCHSLMRANVKILEILKHRELGDYDYEESILPRLYSAPFPIPQPHEETDALQEVMDIYLSEKKPIWEARTMEKNLNLLKMLTFYLGEDYPIQKIDYKVMQGFKQFLLKVPVAFFKTKRFKGMSKDDVLKLPEGKEKIISPKTINMYIGAIITMFTFAMRNGYMEKNYAEGLKLPLKKKPQDMRDIFNPDDLNKIFHSPDYLNDTHEKPFQFWLPVLGLFTGARLGELCQLLVDDVKQVNGLWVLDITEAGGHDKKVKNINSERMIPLHPFITEDLNFIGYVEKMRQQGEARVFPDLPYKHHAYTDHATKWFGRYRKSVGITEAQTKVFHSFRHTVTDNLKQQMIPDSPLKNLLGHAEQGETYGRYGKQLKVETVYKEAVLKLNFDGLDLSHLKKSKYATL